MSRTGRKVAIITGGSQGIGASLVTAYRRQGWSVVATARTMKPTEDPDVLTVDGDLADPATADRIVSGALGRFGRIDTLINNAGVYISKPFTDYTAEDYALVVGVNLTGFFWLTQRTCPGRGLSRASPAGPWSQCPYRGELLGEGGSLVGFRVCGRRRCSSTGRRWCRRRGLAANGARTPGRVRPGRSRRTGPLPARGCAG